MGSKLGQLRWYPAAMAPVRNHSAGSVVQLGPASCSETGGTAGVRVRSWSRSARGMEIAKVVMSSWLVTEQG